MILAACGRGGEATEGKGKGGKGGRGAGKLEYPVDTVVLEPRKLVYTVSAPGTIDAFQVVQITARVAGAVDKVTFTEGQEVKANDTLAVIESERYQIAVQQASATVEKAKATQKAAEMALQRRQTADSASPGIVPGEEIEQKRTAVDTAKADVSAANEALKVANLNLRDSAVRTPIKGTVQTRTVQQGQYLSAGYVLATILQRDPMLLRFQVTEQEAPRLKPGMEAKLTLKESAREFTAHITLVAGAADPTTRTVPITAQLDTTEHDYWLRPGAFCNVTVPIGDARQGIVVPSLAVQPTEKGNIVYVVDEKNIAHARVVQLGMHTPQGGVELTRGVQAGETIAVRGIEPLSDGAPVKVSSKLSSDQADQPPPDAGVAAPPVAPIDGGGDGSGSGEHHRRKGAQ